MPSLGLLLTTCALVAAPAKEEDPSALAERTLQRVTKLPLEHQRVWLRLIEQRYGWAVLLTLKPEDAQREQDRVAKILHQKTVGWKELAALLRQLDQREKAAIARLVRQYRSGVYETFHSRPRDLVDRQEAWYRIWSQWEKSGSPPEQQDRLMDWLADAIKASSKESIRPLPPDPKFGADVELVPEQLVRQLSQPPAARPDATKPPAAQRPADDFVPRPELQARAPLPLRVPDRSQATGPARLPPEAVPLRRLEIMAWLPWTAESPPAAMRPLHSEPPTVADDPGELTAIPSPRHQAMVAVIQRKAMAVPGSSAETVAQANPGDARPQALDPRRQPSELPPARTIEPPPPQQLVAGPAPVVAGPRSTPPPADVATAADHSRASQEVVAQLPHRSIEFTMTQRTTEHRVERRPLGPNAAASPSQPPASPSAQVEQHAQVNIEELGTRIEGINLSLRNLEAELNEKRELTVDQLDSLLSRLDILVLRQRDLALFRDLITAGEQAKVGQIDPSRSAIASIGTRIAELRTRLRDNEAMPASERTTALKHLDELSDRLATLTAEK